LSARHRGIHLPFDRWPAPDRAAWQELFREGNPLDGCGAAYHWAEATRRTNLKHQPEALRPLAGLVGRERRTRSGIRPLRPRHPR
jgi:hypothetical protein